MKTKSNAYILKDLTARKIPKRKLFASLDVGDPILDMTIEIPKPKQPVNPVFTVLKKRGK